MEYIVPFKVMAFNNNKKATTVIMEYFVDNPHLIYVTCVYYMPYKHTFIFVILNYLILKYYQN